MEYAALIDWGNEDEGNKEGRKGIEGGRNVH